ncbi:MAG: type II toxin-antitoxin system Phd/YefM family antitoxin [Lentisphaerota bacterium]
MKANIIDFRTNSHKIIQALDRNENVELFYHGKLKAVINPVLKRNQKPVQESEFFGCLKNESESVEDMMNRVRRNPRYDF